MLAIIEVGKKQSYIFSSNKLQDMMGASMIIRYISEMLPGTWVNEDQIILKGGGHSIFYFDNQTDCRSFIRQCSKKVLQQFPGVELYLASVPYDPQQDLLPEAIDRLFQALASKKSGSGLPFRQFSFGIEEQCQSTQLPASQYVDKLDESRYVSSEIYAKLQHLNHTKVEDYFGELMVPGVSDRIVKEMDDLKDSKGKTAIIHLDGNRMGAKLMAFQHSCVRRSDESISAYNARYREQFQRFSLDIDQKYKSAFREMMRELKQKIYESDVNELKGYREQGVPYRPIIFAGDDITFIMPGVLGVEAAQIMLKKLESDPLKIGATVHRMHACAGVAIVRYRYPFSRAYEIAEQLCASAKTRILQDLNNCQKDCQQAEELDASVLDFHIVHGDWNGSLHDQRAQDYQGRDQIGDFYLTMKPLYIDQKLSDYNWSTFREAYHRVTSKKIARSKIKELRSALKRGPAESERYVRNYELSQVLGTFQSIALEQGKMFTSEERVCPYYDAIEAMDTICVFDEEGSNR